MDEIKSLIDTSMPDSFTGASTSNFDKLSEENLLALPNPGDENPVPKKAAHRLKKKQCLVEDDDGSDCEDVRSTDEDDDAGSLVDFIEDDDDDCSEEDFEETEPTEEEVRRMDVEAIDTNNIRLGKRTRRAPVRYETEVFNTEEYKKLMLTDVPDEELNAIGEDTDDESEEESDDDDEWHEEGGEESTRSDSSEDESEDESDDECKE